jgi:protein-tyrosine phosphatase
MPASPVPGSAVLRLARSARAWARHLPDRALHPRRRAAALARVRAEPLPASLLVVCQGNIYRSPYAAHALARALPPELRAAVRISSAGFVGPGRPAPPAAVAEAARRGVDLEPHRSRLLPVPAGCGLVVVMDAAQRRAALQRGACAAADVLVLGDFDPLPVDARGVRDPWREDAAVLEACYNRIDRCVAALARALVAGKVG